MFIMHKILSSSENIIASLIVVSNTLLEWIFSVCFVLLSVMQIYAEMFASKHFHSNEKNESLSKRKQNRFRVFSQRLTNLYILRLALGSLLHD